MKVTKTYLKQLIREEISKTLNEGSVEKVEKTTMFDAEASMRPGLRVNTFKNTLDIHGNPKGGASYKVYKITLSGGEVIHAQVDGDDLELYDLEDYRIDEPALEAEVAAAIKNLSPPQLPESQSPSQSQFGLGHHFDAYDLEEAISAKMDDIRKDPNLGGAALALIQNYITKLHNMPARGNKNEKKMHGHLKRLAQDIRYAMKVASDATRSRRGA